MGSIRRILAWGIGWMRRAVTVLAVTSIPAGPLPGAPSVVETTPPTMSRDVDPATTQIRVTFSEPMRDGSWSWCGGGYAYPEIAGAPFFEDERTAVLPVKLDPQHTYVVMINCPAGMNFRSASGESAEPHVLRFTTTWGDPLLASSDPQNLAAVDALRTLLAEHYSYAERTGWDWRQGLEDEQEYLLSASSAVEWTWRTAEVLAPFEDKHLHLTMPDGGSLTPWSWSTFYNGNVNALEHRVGPLTRHENIAWWGRREDIGYLAIHAWTGDAEHTALFHRVLDEMSDVQTLIIDVRGNGGGDEVQAREVAARFLAQGEGGTYARNRIRDPQSADGWTPWYDRVVQPAPEEKHIGARVLLLQGGVCLSSNESFIKIMRLSPRVTTIGATTGGSSARPQRHTLPNGVTVTLASWWSVLPDGTLLEGNGIAPDIEVTGDFATDDHVLARALTIAAEE